MNEEERYKRILLEKDQNILEIGYSSVKEPSRTINQFYWVCHSCNDGLKTNQGHDNIIVKAVEHLASEKHLILLDRDKRDLSICGICADKKKIVYVDTDSQFCKECTSEIFRDPTKHPMHPIYRGVKQ